MTTKHLEEVVEYNSLVWVPLLPFILRWQDDPGIDLKGKDQTPFLALLNCVMGDILFFPHLSGGPYPHIHLASLLWPLEEMLAFQAIGGLSSSVQTVNSFAIEEKGKLLS